MNLTNRKEDISYNTNVLEDSRSYPKTSHQTTKSISKPNQERAELRKLIVLSILIVIFLSLLSGCDEGNGCQMETYTYFNPIYCVKSEVVKTAEYKIGRPIETPGKIYFKDDYLFINEVDKGIHVINNKNRQNPIFVGFIDLPGNKDLAAKGDFLYADNYTDLVILDISNKSNIYEVNRVENVFDSYHYYIDDVGLLTGYEEIEEEYQVDCDGENPIMIDWLTNDLMMYSSSESSSGDGIGGSMARFTISSGYLYTVNEYELQLFDISIGDSPIEGDNVNLGWGIETIFPYEDKLFFGARSGMHIYDNSNPAQPEYISTYSHINTCDPVVVQGDLAYVTLRSGSECETFTNQLDVIDIADPYNPKVKAVHEMKNPHGLGIRGNCLFIAEGEFGLKVFNALDALTIGANLVAHHQDVHALDVIPLDDVVFMIGNDGLHQYAYDCRDKFTYLSTLYF